ncbi:hypothetical protein GCM10011374_16240 [Kocuria dechangensis]|uniref:Uncharacterized protein n=1 Tax=Kocuria dechangensis TaxID=1176249 RepID=A0A917GQ94_9MICC|nr:hypothetical protein GCM10011374_16240 [Kocuria dechangensis]
MKRTGSCTACPLPRSVPRPCSGVAVAGATAPAVSTAARPTAVIVLLMPMILLRFSSPVRPAVHPEPYGEQANSG